MATTRGAYIGGAVRLGVPMHSWRIPVWLAPKRIVVLVKGKCCFCCCEVR